VGIFNIIIFFKNNRFCRGSGTLLLQNATQFTHSFIFRGYVGAVQTISKQLYHFPFPIGHWHAFASQGGCLFSEYKIAPKNTIRQYPFLGILNIIFSKLNISNVVFLVGMFYAILKKCYIIPTFSYNELVQAPFNL